MNFKDKANCNLQESDWIEQEKRNCELNYTDREMNRYCREVLERELERRRDICA